MEMVLILNRKILNIEVRNVLYQQMNIVLSNVLNSYQVKLKKNNILILSELKEEDRIF